MGDSVLDTQNVSLYKWHGFVLEIMNMVLTWEQSIDLDTNY